MALLHAAGGRLEKKKLLEQARVRTGRGEVHLRKVIAEMTEAETVCEVAEPRPHKPAAIFVQINNESDERENDEE